jgi:two-component system sensor histidine kinase UhpB
MPLSAHLLIRMTVLGVVCWLLVSLGVVWRLRHEGQVAIEAQADALQALTELQLRRQVTAQDLGGRVPDLARVVSAFGHPVCLRYTAIDQAEAAWGCEAASTVRVAPAWWHNLLADGAVLPLSVARPITLWYHHDGNLIVTPSRAALGESLWARMCDLTGLTAATIVALDVLVWLVLRRLLRPTAGFVLALDRLGAGDHHPQLPPQGAREFRRLSEGIARLGQALAQLTATRSALTLRLIDSQEAERRDIARDLHDELGQCIAALQAVSGGIRQSAVAGQPASWDDTEALDATMNEMSRGLRALLGRLRPPLLDEQGLQLALCELVNAWNRRQRAGLSPALVAVMTQPTHWPAEHSEAVDLSLYRVCQEALTNAARYGDPREPVRLCLDAGAWGLSLTVRNAPKAEARSVGSGLGLRMMEERVCALGGRFEAAQRQGPHGVQFVLTAQWPLHPVVRHA